MAGKPLAPSVRHQAHARRLYTLLNRKYFNGELPRIPIHVEPRKLKHNWAETEFEGDTPVEIILGEDCWDVSKNNSFLRSTMLHEMVHVKIGPSHDSPEWKAEALRLGKLGALVETL